MSTDPGGFRTLKVYRSLDGPHLRIFLHDMGHGFWWVKLATSAKISYRKVVVLFLLRVCIYIYNEFSLCNLCMFHIGCVRCIVQLNPATGWFSSPMNHLDFFAGKWCNGAMVQEETRVSRDPRDHGRAFSRPDEAQVFYGIGLLGKIYRNHNRKQWFLPLNIGLSGFNFPIIQFCEIMIEIAWSGWDKHHFQVILDECLTWLVLYESKPIFTPDPESLEFCVE